MPTTRNAKGPDIVIINQNGSTTHTIQVNALSKKKGPAPMGKKLDSLHLSEFLIICRNILSDNPEIFISKTAEVRNKIYEGKNKKGEVSYWFQPNQYEQYRDNWKLIGESL